ncbi:MAG TPA: VOC family protein [Steroidobacteraceae bacterium]|nr:VOC family protein [Steroidobacteraceae bacterium]
MLAFTAAALAALFLPAPSRAGPQAPATAPTDSAPAPAQQGRLVGLAFAGRSVSDLDRSVAFYEALGFELDPAAPPVWRSDAVFQRIYGIGNARGVTTRMAKMYVDQPAGGRFVIYLRELKGIPRRNLSRHTAWDPGTSHFGLVVPDARSLWSQLAAQGMLHARSWGGRLIAAPGQKSGTIAYITDPDGIDIEIMAQRRSSPAADGVSARPALLPGVDHVGLVVLDPARARAFYADLLGGRLPINAPPWLRGDFYDAAVGGHGNILRVFEDSFPAAFEARLAGSGPALTSTAPGARINFALIEFQNRKRPVVPARITDIGVGYVGFEVQGLEAFLARARAAGASVVSDGIVTMRGGGTRVVMIRDPDVGGFIELFDHPHD